MFEINLATKIKKAHFHRNKPNTAPYFLALWDDFYITQRNKNNTVDGILNNQIELKNVKCKYLYTKDEIKTIHKEITDNIRFERLKLVDNKNVVTKRGYVRCKCECGNKVFIRYIDLLNGKATSCGCKNKKYDGAINGNLTIVNKDKDKFICKCVCGKTMSLTRQALDVTLSCGCKNDNLLNAIEAAKYVNVGYVFFRKCVRCGVVTSYKVNDKIYYYQSELNKIFPLYTQKEINDMYNIPPKTTKKFIPFVTVDASIKYKSCDVLKFVDTLSDYYIPSQAIERLDIDVNKFRNILKQYSISPLYFDMAKRCVTPKKIGNLQVFSKESIEMIAKEMGK